MSARSDEVPGCAFQVLTAWWLLEIEGLLPIFLDTLCYPRIIGDVKRRVSITDELAKPGRHRRTRTRKTRRHVGIIACVLSQSVFHRLVRFSSGGCEKVKNEISPSGGL